MEQNSNSTKNYIDIFNRLYKKIDNNGVEIFICIIIKNDKIKKYSILSIGDFDFAPIWHRQIGKLLKYNPDKIVFIHNHPSGNPTPSKQDIFTHTLIKQNLSYFDVAVECYIYTNNNLYDVFSSTSIAEEAINYRKNKVFILDKNDFINFTEKINYNCLIIVNSQLQFIETIKINVNFKDKAVKEFLIKSKSNCYFLVATEKIAGYVNNILKSYDYKMIDYKKLEE